jgi:CheY-like chemotaxis protein
MAHILLVDDDEILRDTLLQMLELDGHTVSHAASAEEGLTTFGGAAIDLVITDILMPGMDGARLIVELRRSRPHLPIVAISGGRRVLSAEFSLQTASLAGATYQLAKPFSRHELQSVLRQALSGEAPAL